MLALSESIVSPVISLLICVILYCANHVRAGEDGWNAQMWDHQWQVPQNLEHTEWHGADSYTVKGPFYEHHHHHHEPTPYKVRVVTKVRKVPKTVTHTYTTYEDDDEPWISLHVNRNNRPRPTVLLNGWAKDGKFGLSVNIH